MFWLTAHNYWLQWKPKCKKMKKKISFLLHRLSDWEFVDVYFLLVFRNVTANLIVILSHFVAQGPLVLNFGGLTTTVF